MLILQITSRKQGREILPVIFKMIDDMYVGIKTTVGPSVVVRTAQPQLFKVWCCPHPHTTCIVDLYAFFQYFDKKILEIFLKKIFCTKIEKKSSNEVWGNCGSVDIFEQ